MTSRSIILTGFMGTGKSTAGRLIAKLSGRTFVDTDSLIETMAGKPIEDIFSQDGEAAFRRYERAAAHRLAGQPGLVVATGGRLMLDTVNALRLGQGAFVLCLTASPETILARTAADGFQRPLLSEADPAVQVHSLLAERNEAYSQFRQLDTNGRSPEAVAQAALALYDGWEPGQLDEATRIEVRYPGGRYPVIVGRDLLSEVADWANWPGPAAIVTDSNVGPLYAGRLGLNERRATMTMPAGEKHKNLATISDFYRRALREGLDRKCAVFALGGGVVGDTAGFMAATYMRGLPLIQCPTSLLAMVDASVGGKTGIDLPEGKNLVGAFKQPLAVVADLDTLSTLPPSEVAGGLAEVIKHGLIASPPLLEEIEEADWSATSLAASPAVWPLVVEAIQIKRDVVESDPFEGDRRRILNLGHTFAHAIERVSDYAIPHGQAVAMGLVSAARLSAILGHCLESLSNQIAHILDKVGLPAEIPPGLAAGDILAAMGSDKKREKGAHQFVLIRRAGDVFISGDVPERAIIDALRS